MRKILFLIVLDYIFLSSYIGRKSVCGVNDKEVGSFYEVIYVKLYIFQYVWLLDRDLYLIVLNYINVLDRGLLLIFLLIECG